MRAISPAAASWWRAANRIWPVLLRCTKRVLDLVGARPRDLVAAAPTDDDWYANLLWVDGRKHLLLAHAGTLFPVFVADVRKADLLPIGQVAVDQIRRALDWRTCHQTPWAALIRPRSGLRRRPVVRCWDT